MRRFSDRAVLQWRPALPRMPAMPWIPVLKRMSAPFRLAVGGRTPDDAGPEGACPEGVGREGVDTEAGSAILEFILLGLLLLVPVIYLVITAGQLQGGSFAVVGAADQAAKVYADSETPGQGEARARQAAAVAMNDFGLDPASMTMAISCSEACLTPGSLVTVHVQVPVPLPFVPGIGTDLSAATVESSATQIVERFG